MPDHSREIDKWLKWWAVLGTISGYIFGIATGCWGTYQAFKTDSHRIEVIEGWKDKQDAFNERTVIAISRLKALMKDVP